MDGMSENLISLFLENLIFVVSQIPLWVWATAFTLVLLKILTRRPRHHWRIKKASWVLKRLREIGLESGPAAQFGFMRSKAVDPFTFEEAILTALKSRGIKIKRNRRYTGDGGIDGTAWLKGNLMLVQAKLYRGHINPQDVRDFCSLCEDKKAYGLFVHSGRTGPMSKECISPMLDIISGNRLLQFLEGRAMKLFPAAPQKMQLSGSAA